MCGPCLILCLRPLMNPMPALQTRSGPDGYTVQVHTVNRGNSQICGCNVVCCAARQVRELSSSKSIQCYLCKQKCRKSFILKYKFTFCRRKYSQKKVRGNLIYILLLLLPLTSFKNRSKTYFIDYPPANIKILTSDFKNMNISNFN